MTLCALELPDAAPTAAKTWRTAIGGRSTPVPLTVVVALVRYVTALM